MRLALRTLLAATFLAGLWASRASAQWDYMYIYEDLAQNGNTVFGYAATDVNLPPCYFGATCWGEYSSYVEVSLYKDGEWRGGPYSWEEYCWGATAWVYNDVEVGQWRLYVDHELIDLWYWYDGFWNWVPYLYEPEYVAPLTINPEISMSSDQYVNDSETPTAYFNVSSQGGTPTSYAWSFTVVSPPTVGNYPYVNFTDPYDHDTFTNAHWYAHPDDPCSASAISGYTVTATVGFGGIQRTASAGLIVSVPWMPGGITAGSTVGGGWTPGFVGGVYFVLATSFYRTQPQVTIFVPPTSQFWSKINLHEQVHVDQWGPGGMFANRFNPDDLRSAIINLTDSTYQGLLNKVNQAIDAYMGLQMILIEAMWLDAELEAHYVSDPVNPQYLYQVCPY